MKKIILLLLLTCVANVYCQKDIFYESQSNSNVAWFVDSVFIGSYVGIDKDMVENLNVDKNPIKIDNKEYEGRFYISYKQPAIFLSLEDIKSKYIKEKIESPIYLINGSFLTGDISNIKIDENYILKVKYLSSDEFQLPNKEKLKFSIVSIFTKTEENIKKNEKIFIR